MAHSKVAQGVPERRLLSSAAEQKAEAKEDIWQHSFVDPRVRDSLEYAKFKDCIWQNPVRRGLTRAAEQYPSSSAPPSFQGTLIRHRSGFYETAGRSQGFSFIDGFLLLLFIHLGASIRTLLSRNELGAFWRPMTMNGCCYLKHGLCGPSRWSQSPTTRDGNESGNVFNIRCEYLFLVKVCC